MGIGRTVAITVAVLLIAGFGTAALAQVHHEVALTRSIIQAERQAIIAANLPMPEEQSKAFWPVYREYRADLAKVGDRFVALVENYAKSYEQMTDAQAQPMIDEMYAIGKEELKIKTGWLPKLGKVLPPATLMRFLQIENKLDAIIRFELADEIPLVEPMPKSK